MDPDVTQKKGKKRGRIVDCLGARVGISFLFGLCQIGPHGVMNALL